MSAVAGALAVGLLVAPTAPAHAEDDALTQLRALTQTWADAPPKALDVSLRLTTVTDGVEDVHVRRTRVVDDGRRKPRSLDVFENRENGTVTRAELHGYRAGFLYTYLADERLPRRLARLARARAGNRDATLARARDNFGPDEDGPLTDGAVDLVLGVARWSSPGSAVHLWIGPESSTGHPRATEVSAEPQSDGTTTYSGKLVFSTGWTSCDATFRTVEAEGVLTELETWSDCTTHTSHSVTRLNAMGDAAVVPKSALSAGRSVNYYKHVRAAHQVAQRRLLQPLLVKARKKLNRKARRTGEPVRTAAVNRTVRRLSPVDWVIYKPRRGVHLRYSPDLRGRLVAKKGRAVACLKPYRKTRSPLPRMKRCRP